MIRLLIAAVLSSLVLFVWGFVFWNVSPLPFGVMRALPGDEVLVEALKKNLPESGTYFSPFPKEPAPGEDAKEAEETLKKQYREGPLVQITYRKEGLDPTSPTMFGMGLAHMFVSSLLIGGLLLLAAPALPSYSSRVLFVFLAGVFASITVNLSSPIWFHHPWGLPLLNTLYHATNWLLAGFVLGAVIRSRPS